MATGDGIIWNESLPDNTTIANEIDDYDRDLRVGVRSRMALEHVWPSAHTGTSSGGRHTYITFQAQAAAPTMAGTTAGGLYVTTEVSPALIFVRSNGSAVTLVGTAGTIPIIAGGTQGAIPICSSASATTLTTLAPGTSGQYLQSAGSTGAPAWATIASYVSGAKIGTMVIQSTGTKTITGLGFQPRLVIFLVGYASWTDVKPAFGIFAYDGTSIIGLSSAFYQGDTSGLSTLEDSFTVRDNTGTIIAVSGTSLDSDGFTMNVTDADANYVCRYIAIK